MADVTTYCGPCGKVARHKCSRCKAVWYCCPDCQRADWSLHKKSCVATGSRPAGAPPIADEIDAGLRDLAGSQQKMVKDRSPCFWAGVRGTFEVTKSGRPDKAYAADKRIRDGKRVDVRWWYTDDTGATVATETRKGLLVHNGASIAAELFTFAANARTDPRHVEGCWLYLIGEPDIFWSAMIARRCTGHIAPAPGPGRNCWEHTLWGREMKRFESAASTAATLGSAPPTLGSRSYAAIHAAETAVREGFVYFAMGPEGEEVTALPATDAERPDWWTYHEGLWSAQLDRCIAAKRPQCMFHVTPLGCRAGETACAAMHDPLWRDTVERLKRCGPLEPSTEGVDAAAAACPSAASAAPPASIPAARK